MLLFILVYFLGAFKISSQHIAYAFSQGIHNRLCWTIDIGFTRCSASTASTAAVSVIIFNQFDSTAHTHAHPYTHTQRELKLISLAFLEELQFPFIGISTLLAFRIHWSLFDKYFQSAVLIKNAEHNSAQECVPLRRQAKAN